MTVPNLNPARERHWVCAQRIRERRLALGLTQREVVARLERRGNRITNRGLSAMENGRGLDLGLLPELAEVLRCTVTYLLGLTADPASWHPASTPQVPSPVPIQNNGSGILGPGVPDGFAAPGRTRRR
ncbi:helix-turn-helix domain-containing protein [Actinocrispum wychmicini]|uniref:Helix-turn-helix protein n=1 Tax=Actinocrispum wychmicini TaxID=1213861 RepID=A0A4R2JY93_9PSEU|nr:helix-turn-helix transcriptional regulator [Actinocrispum wychmicini]TCO62398.1 helix-turn-helix protein [Actinocrispum wychmicini]